MCDAGPLLARYTGRGARTHDDKVVTLKSNLRCCSDASRPGVGVAARM
jgi:hypothetical protein